MDATHRPPAAVGAVSGIAAPLLLLVLCTAPVRPAAAQASEPLSDPLERIVSLLPSATDLIVALGAGPRLVGRTSYDTDPRVASAVAVGEPVRPVPELVVSLRPDLLVTWAGITDPRLAERLADYGSRIYPARMESVADVVRTARELGRLLGVPAEGEAIATAITRDLEALSDSAPPPARRPRVLVLLDPPTLLTAGPGSFTHELVEAAGGRNVFADAPVPWLRVAPESLVVRDPDAIVVAERPGLADEAAGRVWGDLRAVREERVLRLPADLLARPGPDLVRVARELARFLREEPYR